MKTIKCEIKIKRSQSDVFDLTQDYVRRLEWDPYLCEAFVMGEAEIPAVGVEVYCKNITGSAMISRYISFEPPRVAAITMIKGPNILKKFSGAWNVKKITDEYSRLIFTYHFELKGSWLGRVFLPIAVYLFKKDMKKRQVAIKRFMEFQSND